MARLTVTLRSPTRIVAAAVLAVGVLGAGIAAAQDPGAVIETRKAGLKQAGGAMKAVSEWVKDGNGTPDDVQKAAATLMQVAGAMPNWFPAGTGVGVGKSEAKPEIWKNPADFQAKIAAFQAEAKTFQTVAATGDKAAIGKQLGATGGTCKACHDAYKAD